MADSSRLTYSRSGILRLVVLAPTTMAGFPRGNGRHRTLAVAGGGPIRAGICRCATVRMGLRMDGARHACPGRSSAATGSGRLLPPRAEPHVRRLRGGLDRAMGNADREW